jgi:hypothetical protein
VQEVEKNRRGRNLNSAADAFLLKGSFMQQFNIRLRRNEREQAWTVEINGNIHKYVDSAVAKELVKRALIEAEEYLNK